jgi:signal transduction histidine kinase
MIKSLYTRMLLVFLGSVILSLALGFAFTSLLYKERVTGLLMENIYSTGSAIIETYKESSPERRNELLQHMSSTLPYVFLLYDKDGNRIFASGSNRAAEISPAHVRQVLEGRAQGADGGYDKFVAGLRFEIEGQPYALFIKPYLNELGRTLAWLYHLNLIIVLLIGSLLIVLSVRYIVRPIQHLTRATQKMAKGDFSIYLESRRKDEIGQLTESFNQMASELGKLEQTRQQFVSDVSHEIQSPLTSITGFAQALKSKNLSEEERVRLLTIIEDESRRLSRLSGDLLQLSKLEHDKLNMSKFRLDEQLRKVIIALEPQWSAKKLDIELDLEEMVIVADEDKLSQVWTNIISNSIKFTDPGGKIAVTGKKYVKGLEVTIQDSGIGIPQEELRNIFKPFYKLDKSRTRAAGGNGIGLSIVKRIIDLHRAEIRAESRPGEGTAFTVYFPS